MRPLRGGWLLEAKDGSVTIYTPFGKQQTFEINEQPKPGRYGGPFITTYAVEPIEQEVARVAELRQKGDPDFALSERGGLTGQFQGHGASLGEAMLAVWLHAGKHDELAAKVLLPALETVYEDHNLVDRVKDQLGVVYAYHMLVSFAGDRDYAQTLKWADVVQKQFRGSRFDGMAAELTRQLPLRTDDFKKLKLPTGAEWGNLRKGMDRAQQIAYLCDRLRLLNCFQMSQPGGVDTSEKQYAEACGISDDAAWGSGQGKTEVINPLVELDAQKLTVDDILLLTPYLKEDWFMPSVEFWRDFSPQRELLRTRAEIAAKINHLACDDICDDAKMTKMNAVELGTYIETINQFARDNKGKPEADLLLQTLQKAVAGKERWFDVRWRADRLVELGEKRALAPLETILRTAELDEFDAEEILNDVRRIDPSLQLMEAPEYLSSKSLSVRANAALKQLGTERAAVARQTLGEVLATADEWHVINVGGVVEALLADKSDASRREALRVFDGFDAMDTGNEVERRVVKDFADAGMSDGYRYYLRMLDLPGNSAGRFTWGGPVGEVMAHYLAYGYADSDAEMKKIKEETEDKPVEAKARVRAWVERKIKEIEAKKG